MATMLCWRRLSVSASAALRGAHRADNMMAASGDSQSHKSVRFLLFPCLQKYGARPYPPIHRLRKDAPKSTNGLRSG